MMSEEMDHQRFGFKKQIGMVLYDLLYTLKNPQKCAEKFDLGQ